MYLKKLEVNGFKSFAGRTVFEFGPGITAIVGPNGSGKSNIADALRWVLGEQSGRLLRARKLDEIIFAGSSKRPRADRAEVSLTLDNGDRWLPIDAPEVTITRRGTRSGDSDYYINGKKTRLRDVQSLFMQANVTQSSYAIIGQGLVESVLNLRPEERRQLIEEAADIQRYRLKIEEAQGRLHATHENIARVKLLMREISPRLSQLERQAERAGQHARLSHQLAQALRVFYEQQWHRAQEALTVARATHDQAQAEFIQARVALVTCQRELDDITSRLDENRQQATAALAQRDRIDQRIRDLERTLAIAHERRGILEARQKELQTELELLEEERRLAQRTLASEEEDRARLERAVAQALEALEGKQAELAKLEAQARESQSHAADAEAKARRLETAAAELGVRIRRLKDAEKQLEKEAARLETRRRSLVNQMAEHLRVLRGLRAQDEEAQAEVLQTSLRRQALDSDIRELRETLAKVEADQNARLGKLEALQARLGVLKEAQRQVDAAAPTDTVTIEGALTTIYEIIRVPRGLEDAIAAALADHLEAFVFASQVEAVEAVQALVQQNAPRTTLIPLDSMKQVYPLNVMREKGVVGVASKLIKYQPRYEKLINSLLGRTIVVQDAATGARLVKRGLGTVVTLDGIVFHPSGSISGGQPQASRPFVLGYERDMETLPKEMERVRRSLEVVEREAASLRERLKRAELALAGLTREAEGALDRRLTIQNGMSERQQKLAQLRGELRGLIGEQQGLRERRTAYQTEAEALAQERELMLAEARQDHETAKHLARAQTLFQQRRKELLKAVDAAAAAFGRVDGELRSLTIRKENAEAALARLEAQASAKAVQLRGLEMELSTLEGSLQSKARELERARAEMDAFLEANRNRLEGAHHLEARQRDLHSQVISSQNRLFEAERKVLEAEAEVRRWESEIENMRLRMSDDGLTMTPEGEVMPRATEAGILPLEGSWLTADGPEDSPGGLRPISGGAEVDPAALAREIESLRSQIRALGPVNVEAREDYQSLRERYDFLERQVGDLETAEESLKRAIQELTALMRRRFQTTFETVAQGFERYFLTFFGGGHARLALTNPKDPFTSGVEIEARPPGKRTKSLAQLSGGEKALTSVSFLFALLEANPSLFCVLDEVDAMLDEANVMRFVTALKELAQRTQFTVITHNRRTIEVADTIYGVSMGPDAASRVLSMRLADLA